MPKPSSLGFLSGTLYAGSRGFIRGSIDIECFDEINNRNCNNGDNNNNNGDEEDEKRIRSEV